MMAINIGLLTYVVVVSFFYVLFGQEKVLIIIEIGKML